MNILPPFGVRHAAVALLLLFGSWLPVWAAPPPEAEAAELADANVLTRKGVRVEFDVKPVREDAAELRAGDFAEVAFRLTSAIDGTPVSGLYPGVWIDLAKTLEAGHAAGLPCKERVGLYLRGTVGMRPMVDLNSYFILVMNRDATISVIDPFVGITGITNLYAQVNLKRPAGDWIKTRDQQRLLVTMPQANQVAVVNLQSFKVTQYLDVGRNPLRIAVQPDDKYLWVANNGQPDESGSVTVIDLDTLTAVAEISTGKGHHELAFSDDSRYAFVSNRSEGSVSVIDSHHLTKIKDINTGGTPLALGFSSLSRSLYVADGQTGRITVVHPERHEVLRRLETKPGLGPLGVSPDGRWVVVVNTLENVVVVIDTSTNALVHTIPVGQKPYQVTFSRAFAYIRSLGTERVSMINLSQLASGEMPPVSSFAAGSKAPQQSSDISIAAAITPTSQEAAVLVVSPADNTVYFYMEGMNAPMGAFRNYGQRPRAVTVADRSLKEREPGVYTGKFRIPEAGVYDVAFLIDTPEVLHCFSLSAAHNPTLTSSTGKLDIEFLTTERVVQAGDTVRLRFRLTVPLTGEPRTGLTDVNVLYFRAPAFGRTIVPATEIANGIYEAALPLTQLGAYYAHVGVPSERITHGELSHYIAFRTQRPRVAQQPPPETTSVSGKHAESVSIRPATPAPRGD